MILSLNQKPTVSFGHIYKTGNLKKALKKIRKIDNKRWKKGEDLFISMLPVNTKNNKIMYYIFDGEDAKILARESKPEKLIAFIKQQVKKGSKFFNLDKQR